MAHTVNLFSEFEFNRQPANKNLMIIPGLPPYSTYVPVRETATATRYWAI